MSAKKRGKENSHLLTRGFFVKLVFVFVIYFLLGKLGLSLAFLHPSASPVWPAAGFAIAILLLMGYRYWPAIFLGAFLVNLTTEGTTLTSLIIALGNTFEGLVGAFFTSKFAQGSRVLDKPRSIFLFFLIAFIVGIIGATVGVITLAYSGFISWTNYMPVWLTWWIGDAIGAIIILPLIVSWYRFNPEKIKIGEAVLILLATIIISGLIFTSWSPFSAYHYPIQIVSIIPLIWACFSFNQKGVTSIIVIISAIAIFGTLSGFGPFAPHSPNEALTFLQIFMGFTSFLGLTISSLIKGRDKK